MAIDKTSNPKKTPYKWATLALAGVLLCYQFSHMLTAPIWLDDAFFAIVAKGLAAGLGYKAVLFNESYPFHFGISLGPVIMLPAALMIMLLGNQHWVTGCTQIAFIWMLLLAIFKISGDLFTNKARWLFCFVFLALALLLTAGDFFNFSIETGDHFALWYLMMGEIPSALLVVVAVITLFAKEGSLRRMLVGGLALGCAVLIKTITAIAVIICVPVVLAALMITIYPRTQKIRLALALIGAVITPFILFEAIKIITMGWPDYLLMQAQTGAFYKHLAMARSSDGITHNLLIQLASLMSFIGVFTTLLVFPLVCYIAFFAYNIFWKERALAKNYNAVLLAGFTFTACFVAQLTWWFFFSQPGFPRYLVTALVYFSAGIACMLASADQVAIKKQLILLFCLSVTLESLGNIKVLLIDGFPHNHQLEEQLKTVAALQELKKNNVILFSCNLESRMEYLMEGNSNFMDCAKLPSYQFDRPAALYMYFFAPNKTYHLSLTAHDYFTLEPYPPEVLALCKKTIFTAGRAEIRMCEGATQNTKILQIK